MRNQKLLLVLLVLFLSIGTNKAQKNNYREINKKYGGECLIISSDYSKNKELISKTFKIEVKESGNYYCGAWMMGVFSKKELISVCL